MPIIFITSFFNPQIVSEEREQRMREILEIRVEEKIKENFEFLFLKVIFSSILFIFSLLTQTCNRTSPIHKGQHILWGLYLSLC